jgi:uncharacterized protein (DUF1778 family)
MNMANTKMHQVMIYLDDEQDKELRDAAAQAGQSLTEYVRRAIKARVDAPWLNMEKRNNDDLRESLQRWHNRGERA